MPTRRPSPTTARSAPSRAVVKKSTPVGRECALVLPAASGQALELSYWDLWFTLVADADFEGSWDRFVAHLRVPKNQGGSSRLAERKLSHLRELERRLRHADVAISAIVAQVDQLPVEYDGLAIRSSRENRANMNGPTPCGTHPDNVITPTRCAGSGHAFLCHPPPMPHDSPPSSQRAAGFLRTNRLGWHGSWIRFWMRWPA